MTASLGVARACSREQANPQKDQWESNIVPLTGVRCGVSRTIFASELAGFTVPERMRSVIARHHTHQARPYGLKAPTTP